MPKSVRPLEAMPSRLTIKRGDGVAVDLKIEEEPCVDTTGLTRLALYAITFTAELPPICWAGSCRCRKFLRFLRIRCCHHDNT